MHRSVLVIDVEKFGDPARTNADQIAVRAGMYRALEGALANARISRSSWATEDRGNGALLLITPEVPKSWLVTRLPLQLAAALGSHNTDCAVNARIRLRMALHVGEIHPDAHGVTGSAVNRTFRLIEAPALKSALDASAGVLALIVSGWFYDEVVQHEPAAEPGCYRHVHAVVKETRAAAWIRILDAPAGKKIPVTLWSHFVIRKPWHDGITSHQLGLAAAREIRDRTGEAWMLAFLGYAHRVLRRSGEALGYCQQALDIGRELGYRLGQAWCLITMSAILRGLQRSEEAIGHCDQALAISRELGDRWGQGVALDTSARASMDLGRFEEAVTTCRQALSVHRDIGDRNGEADALNTLSAACRGMGRFREAVGYSRQALSIVREIGDRHREGITLTKLCAALCADGQTDTARRCWRDALAILEGLASPKADEVRMLLEKLDADEAGQHVAGTTGKATC